MGAVRGTTRLAVDGGAIGRRCRGAHPGPCPRCRCADGQRLHERNGRTPCCPWVNVLRFEFPYMAQRRLDGGKRPPNPAPRLLECWREVYATVRPYVAGRLAIGGKSMGGRMASLLADELQADALVCLGYPFYAAGKPEKPRVEHLAGLKTPALIVQGERDALGSREAVKGYTLSPSIEVLWLVAGIMI